MLVGAAFFQLISGLLNVAEWYPWTFFFPPVHFAIAWVAIGALAVHIAVKLPVITRALSGSADEDPHPVQEGAPPATHSGPLSRRGLLALAFGAAGVSVIATVGDKIPAFRSVSVLAQRNGSGPQGLPVNRTAGAAGVTAAITSPDYALVDQRGLRRAPVDPRSAAGDAADDRDPADRLRRGLVAVGHLDRGAAAGSARPGRTRCQWWCPDDLRRGRPLRPEHGQPRSWPPTT